MGIELNRRCFLKKLSLCCFFGGMGSHLLPASTKSKEIEPPSQKALDGEALFYKRGENNSVRCQLCFRRCFIPEGTRGFCRNRENRAGILRSLFTEDRAAFRSIPSSWNRCITWSQVIRTSAFTRHRATSDVSIAITGTSLNLLQKRSGLFAVHQRKSSRKHCGMDVDQYPTASTNLRSFMN